MLLLISNIGLYFWNYFIVNRHYTFVFKTTIYIQRGKKQTNIIFYCICYYHLVKYIDGIKEKKEVSRFYLVLSKYISSAHLQIKLFHCVHEHRRQGRIIIIIQLTITYFHDIKSLFFPLNIKYAYPFYFIFYHFFSDGHSSFFIIKFL